MVITEFAQQHTAILPPVTGQKSIDLILVTVSLIGEPSADVFVQLINEYVPPPLVDVLPLDGKPKNLTAITRWIGDRQLALQFIGLGSLIGVFETATPQTLGLPEAAWREAAINGWVGYVPTAAYWQPTTDDLTYFSSVLEGVKDGATWTVPKPLSTTPATIFEVSHTHKTMILISGTSDSDIYRKVVKVADKLGYKVLEALQITAVL